MKTTREKAEIMLHYADGGEIEAKIAYSNWIEDKDPTWEWGRCDYRIKQKA